MKAKLAAFVFAAAIVGFSAQAQTDTAPEIPAASNAPVVDMEEFCRWQRNQTRMYPRRALERGINGSATLDCSLQEDGAMRACQIVDETPGGWEFGDATIKVACQFRVEAGRESTPTDYVYERDGERRLRRVVNWTQRR